MHDGTAEGETGIRVGIRSPIHGDGGVMMGMRILEGGGGRCCALGQGVSQGAVSLGEGRERPVPVLERGAIDIGRETRDLVPGSVDQSHGRGACLDSVRVCCEAQLEQEREDVVLLEILSDRIRPDTHFTTVRSDIAHIEALVELTTPVEVDRRWGRS